MRKTHRAKRGKNLGSGQQYVRFAPVEMLAPTTRNPALPNSAASSLILILILISVSASMPCRPRGKGQYTCDGPRREIRMNLQRKQ